MLADITRKCGYRQVMFLQPSAWALSLMTQVVSGFLVLLTHGRPDYVPASQTSGVCSGCVQHLAVLMSVVNCIQTINEQVHMLLLCLL